MDCDVGQYRAIYHSSFFMSNDIFVFVQKKCFTSISICVTIQEGISSSSDHILVDSTRKGHGLLVYSS